MSVTSVTLWVKIKIGHLTFMIHNNFCFSVTHMLCDTVSQFSDSVAAAIRRMVDEAILCCVVFNYGSSRSW